MEYLAGKLLRAFKKATDMTLEERTLRVIEHQKNISNKLKKWEWVLSDKQKTTIDIRDNNVFDIIYSEAKKGMNTGLVSRTRYKPVDTPGTQSRVSFYANKKIQNNPFSISYKLGYYGQYNVTESISIDHFEEEPDFETYNSYVDLALEIIQFYSPDELYVTGDNDFNKLTKWHNHYIDTNNAPWTGWLIYLNYNIKFDYKKIGFCNTLQLENGVLIETTEREIFDSNNLDHVKNALKLEDWFILNKVCVK